MPERFADRRRRVEFRMLNDQQVEDIHLASLAILSRTGIVVAQDEARELLESNGASVDGELVRIPPGLVEQALANAPSRVLLFNRNNEPAVDLAADRSYFGTGSDTPTYVDPYTGEIKPTNRESVGLFARLCDALPNIDFVMSMGIAKERPGNSSFVHQYAAMLENTLKPIVFTAQGTADIEPIYQIALAAAGGDAASLRARPTSLLYTEPISPLILTRESMEMVLFCAKHAIPVTYPTGMMAGGTGPVTLAGSIALGNAETLAALTVLQLARPGSPYVYGGNVTAMDMRTSIYPYAAPEFHMAFSAFCDLGRHYGLPVWGLAGASDAKRLDPQAAAEAAYEILLARLSGSNLVHDVGYLNTGLTACMEMIVLCDEIIDYTNRIARGIEVNDETLALDAIDEVGPRGNFLSTEHTVRHFREHTWRPGLFVRDSYQAWEANGARELIEPLNEKVREILDSHHPAPLPDDVQEKINTILAEREKLTD